MYRQQQKNSPLKGVYLPISKLYSILAAANLLAPNDNLWLCFYGQENSLRLKSSVT